VAEGTIEERETRLEKLVDILLHRPATSRRTKDGRRTAGLFDADPLMKELIEESWRIREEDRRTRAPTRMVRAHAALYRRKGH
jgi:hypothetical protein